MTAIPQVTPLPAPPQRGQDPQTFVENADNLMDALPDFVDELNDFGEALIDATTERVVNEAAASYAGALDAKNLANAARNAAQAAAASINPDDLVHKSGAETITGAKDFTGGVKLAGTTLDPVQRSGDQSVDGNKSFVKKIVAGAGIRVNNVDLTGLTAAGKALAEAADVEAQKAILGIGVEAVGGIGALVAAASTALAANTSIELGTTVAGSSLVVSSGGIPSALGGINLGANQPTPGVQSVSMASLGLSGTWRLQTRLRTSGSGNDGYVVGLWKRIA